MNKILVSQSAARNFSRSAIFQVLVGFCLMVACANICIPWQPVPITLHSIGVALIGVIYSPRVAFMTLFSYVLAGVLGMPIFSDFRGGVDYFTGTTAGYLIGMIFAAPAISLVYSHLPKSKILYKFTATSLATISGHAVILICGLSWLSVLIGFKQAFYSGFIVLIPTGIVKMIVFSTLFSYISNNFHKNCDK